MAKLISKTYGDALFETALEKQTMDSLFEEAQVVLEAFAQNPKLSELMVHPKILKEEKLQIVEEIFKGVIGLHRFFSNKWINNLTNIGKREA